MNWLTVGYIGLIAILVLIFLLKKYVQRWLGVFAHGLFILSLLGAIVGLVSIRPFVFFAERSLQQSGTLETLRKIDTALPLEDVIAPVKDLWETIKGLWNGEAPSKQPEEQASDATDNVGMLEGEVYPQLVVTVAKSYRGATMALSVLGLVLSIYLSYTVSQTGELERRIRELERVKIKA
jgi:hypothetical protein